MAKLGRSPNYPRITFEDAIGKIRKVYGDIHTYPATKEVVAKALGYTSINGNSLAMLGALKGYGLLENAGKELKVSADAVAIMEMPEDSLERIDAINKAAFAPDIFEELREKYGEKLPKNELLRHFLIQNKYLPKAADEVIRIYRANLEFVNQFNLEYNGNENEDAIEETTENKMQSSAQTTNKAQPMPPPLTNGTVVTIHIPTEGDVKISFAGEVTPDIFQFVNGILDLQKKTFPAVSKPSEPQENN